MQDLEVLSSSHAELIRLKTMIVNVPIKHKKECLSLLFKTGSTRPVQNTSTHAEEKVTQSHSSTVGNVNFFALQKQKADMSSVKVPCKKVSSGALTQTVAPSPADAIV